MKDPRPHFAVLGKVKLIKLRKRFDSFAHK